MKKFINILSLIAVAALTVVSCVKEQEAHEPGPAEAPNCYGVYFPSQDASGSHVYNPTQDKSVDIMLKRTNTKGAITVPIKTSFSEDGIFTVTEASFADGQDETTFTVRFDNAKDGVDYKASFVIEDSNYAALYNEGAIAMDFSVLCVEMITLKDEKGNPATVTFTVQPDFLPDFGIEETYTVDGTIEYYEVDGIRYGKVVPAEGGIWKSEAVINFIWYPKVTYNYKDNEYQPIEVAVGNTGYELDGSEVGADHPCAVLFSDYYHHYVDLKGTTGLGTFLDFMKNNGENYELSYYDGHGGFYFNLVYDIESTNYWYGFCEGSVVGIASGYLRVDYGLKLAADYTYDGVTPVDVLAGVDVASIKYAIYEGELTATQTAAKVDGIAAGTEDCETFSDFDLDEETEVKYATLGIELDKTADYTLVAVAFDDKDKPQNSASVVFRHVTATDTEEYAVDINVLTEATPARYVNTGNYTEYNSFAFAVYGSDITEAHILVAPANKVTTDVLAMLKADEDGTYTVDEETIAKINGEGGFYDVIGGLSDGTDYLLVVWATNGYEEQFTAGRWSTTPSPEVWKHYGTATWTDVFFGTWYGADPVTYDVELEQSEDDPTRFRLLNVYGEPFPYNDPGDWDDSKDYYLVINTADPDYTWFEQYQTGTQWSAEGEFILTTQVANYLGQGIPMEKIKDAGTPAAKYADNKVTFEYRAILKTMSNMTSWYYGNNDETNPFVIVFNPGATLEEEGGDDAAGMPAVRSLRTSQIVRNLGRFGKVTFERDARACSANVTVSYNKPKNRTAKRSVAASL